MKLGNDARKGWNFRRHAETSEPGYRCAMLRTVAAEDPGTSVPRFNCNEPGVVAATLAVAAAEKVTNPLAIFGIAAFEQASDGLAGSIQTALLRGRF